MIKIKAGVLNPLGTMQVVSLRCPVCRQQGTFDPISGVADVMIAPATGTTFEYVTGQRRCPNKRCLAQVFVVMDSRYALLACYPPERFDFDASNVPPQVAKAFEEATACHSTGSFVAAAMMVRKTCELLCADRKAEGKDLKERIRNLGSKIILPVELLDAADHLRLLGNDAAHVEAKTYDEVGKEEVEVAFELTKEILKATYQYTALLGRLKGMQKPTT